MPKPTGLRYAKPVRTKGRGCRVSDRDEEAKRRLGYTNPRSFVRRDGSEVLFGEDWQVRRREAFERSGHWCQWPACGLWADDPDHIVKRSKYRDDRLTNLRALCRYHHRLVDGRRIGGRKANG